MPVSGTVAYWLHEINQNAIRKNYLFSLHAPQDQEFDEVVALCRQALAITQEIRNTEGWQLLKVLDTVAYVEPFKTIEFAINPKFIPH